MKRIIIILMILLLSACGTAQNDAVVSEKPETVYLLTEITSYFPDGTKDDYRHATYEYDENGCLSELTRRDDRFYGPGEIITFDHNGNMTRRTSVQGSEDSIYEYDSQNRLVKEITGSEETLYQCDDNGNVVKRISGAYEESFTYEYDDKGRIISKTYDTWFGSPVENWTYDGDKLIRHEWPSYGSADEYSYDDKERFVRETHSNNGETEYVKSYEYDDLNNLVKMYVYNPSGELTGYAKYTYITADIEKSKQTYSNETIIKEFGIMPPYPYNGP